MNGSQGEALEPEKDLLSVEILDAPVQQECNYLLNLLHLAAWSGGWAIFRWLVDQGADKDRINWDWICPLSLAACFGHWVSAREGQSLYQEVTQRISGK
jgi:ankyrin repeat protein